MKNKKKNMKLDANEDRLMQKRLGAFVVDWMVVALLINIIVTFSHSILTNTTSTNNYFPSFPTTEGYTLGIAAFVASYLYMVVVPFFFKETLGKRWLHLEVRKKDGSKATIGTRTIRFFATVLLEPRLFNFSLVFYLLLSMALQFPLNTYFEVASWTITILSGLYALITKKGLFHDAIAKTKVVIVET